MIEHIIQLNKNECGIACCKMILDFYRIKVSYEEIKNCLNLTPKGIVLSELFAFLKQFKNFEAYEMEDEKELSNFLPAIVLIENHYIIVWKIDKGEWIYSDPGDFRIRKKKFEKIRKLGAIRAVVSAGYMEITNDDLFSKGIHLHLKKYSIPYCLLLVVEIFLLTFSMFYLFSIEDFTIFKIVFFLIVIFINCFITLLKNYYISQIQKQLDHQIVDKVINYSLNKHDEDIIKLKSSINNAYQLKINIFGHLSAVIPGIILLAISIAIFVFIDFILSLLFIFIFLAIFCFHYFLSKRKNKQLYLAKIDEFEFNRNWEINYINPSKECKTQIIENLEKMKQRMASYSKMEQTQAMIIGILRQAIMMLILIYCYTTGLDQYIIFIVTFLFYAFDGLLQLSDYFANLMEHRLIKEQFANLNF